MGDQRAQDMEKRAAAARALREIQPGMVVGLGTGSTAEWFIRLLAERPELNGTITGIATSRRSEQLAGELGIALADLQAVEHVDVTVDGADQVQPGSLAVIKGLGGALVREKLVALASDRLIIVADRSKIVEELGRGCPVPVEVVPFGWRVPARQLEELGGTIQLRLQPAEQEPFVSDNGNYILDVDFGAITDPAGLASRIKSITGVVDHGLFIELASSVIIGTGQEAEEYLPDNPRR